MSIPLPSPPLEGGVERLLSSLAGVVSARVIAGAGGKLEEIHILATPALHPKQIVRNVESALTAGLGIEIDRRIISVAQLRDGAVTRVAADAPLSLGAAPRTAPEPALATTDAATRPARLVLVGFDARSLPTYRCVCRVVLRSGDTELSGTGESSSTQQGRAEAAARAVFAALQQTAAGEQLGLEGAALVEAQGRTYVLVAARGFLGRHATALAGAALLVRSPEEAGILAALQATNRWSELHH